MRVAYLGNFQPGLPPGVRPWSTETHWSEGFELAGHEVVRLQEEDGCWRTVPARARAAGADFVFWTRTYGLDRDLPAQADGLAECRRWGLPVAAGHLDKFFGLPREHQVTDEHWFSVDVVFTADGGNQDRFEEAGVRHVWLPPAVHEPECAPGRFRPEMASGVAFVGSWRGGYHPEWQHRAQLVDWLRQTYPRRVRFWPEGNRQVRGADLRDLYASVKVLVGDSCMVDGRGRYWCADDQTEALTESGWRSHEELKVGDRLLAIDHETGLTRWEPALAINRFDAVGEPMRLLDGQRHSSLTTLNHRWPVIRSTSELAESRGEPLCPECGRSSPSWRGMGIHRRAAHGVRGTMAYPVKRRVVVRDWRSSETMQENDRIPVAAPCADLPSEPKWSDAFVELVAWTWTEGCIRRESGRYRCVVQSQKANPAYVARIRACLTALCGPPRERLQGVPVPAWREADADDQGMVQFAMNAPLSDLVSGVAPRHIVQGWFPATLTAGQLRIFIETSIDADGCRRSSRRNETTCLSVTLAQRDPDRLDAFEAACALLGVATNRRYTGGMWVVHVKNRTETAPLRRGLLLDDRIISYDGVVWCPTTQTGTWLARRRGTVYFTGNSDRVPETLGRGGALVHPDTDWGGQYRPGEHLATWPLGDWSALRRTIDDLLAVDNGRAAMAARGREHVLAHHTYTVRARQVVAELERRRLIG